MKEFSRFLLFLFLICISTSYVKAQLETLPDGFNIQIVSTDLNLAVGLTFDEEGTMYVWEKGGKIWLVKEGIKLPEPLLDISDEVGNYGDGGFLGMTLDNDFEVNGYFYCYYVVDRYYLLNSESPDYDPTADQYWAATIARIVRFQADINNDFESIVPDSKHILIGQDKTNGIPILHTSHGGGSIHTATDGTLLITTGDGSTWVSPYAGNGPPFFEEYVSAGLADGIIRENEEVGAYRAQLVNNHNGKLLRIDPETGAGLPSNPYYNPAEPSSPASRVWSLGLRNPYTSAVKPGTGATDPTLGLPGSVYIADVGAGLWEEINIVKRSGMNFGWPNYEGIFKFDLFNDQITANKDMPNPLYGTGDCDQEFLNFQDLLKQASSNELTFENPCDPNEVLEAESILRFEHSPPALALSHHPDQLGIYVPGFDENGETTSTVLSNDADSPVPYNSIWLRSSVTIAGDFYDGLTFPEEYHNAFAFADYTYGYIKFLKTDLNDELIEIKNFYRDSLPITHLETNPADGCLYFTVYPNGVQKICYGNNVPPQAIASADVYYGVGPLSVQFTGADSFDPEGEEISYLWNFGNGQTSTEQNPIHTFTSPNSNPIAYTVTLKVSDAEGGFNTQNLIISLNNTPPSVEISSFEDGLLYSSTGFTDLPLEATVVDLEHGPNDLTYEWQLFFGHNTHEHPEPIDNSISTTALIQPAACDGEIHYWRVTLKVTDGAGLFGTAEKTIYPDCSAPFVQVLELNATALEKEVLVDWTSSEELNLDYYELQKSTKDNPFETINTQQGKNLTAVDTYYEFLDENPVIGVNTYRLKMVSNDSKIVYSESVEAWFLGEDDVFVVPNPAKDHVNIVFEDMISGAAIEFFTPSGQLFRKITFEGSGQLQQRIDITNWHGGIYFYRIKNGEEDIVGKLLVDL